MLKPLILAVLIAAANPPCDGTPIGWWQAYIHIRIGPSLVWVALPRLFLTEAKCRPYQEYIEKEMGNRAEAVGCFQHVKPEVTP